MLNKAQEISSQIVDWRRDFHMHPELGFEEKRTAAKVADVLGQLGYRVRTGVGKTGVVADWGTGEPIFAIRADMDALPIQETNDVPYKSQNDGIMHACGHDCHVAIALGTATLLSQEDFPGTVRFLFQPAEETDDDENLSGAPRMIEDSALEGVAGAIALHVSSDLEAGCIELAVENAGAGVDTFYAKVIGKGGHGSTPEKVVDPIYISSYVIQAIHGIVSRKLWPFDPAVISIGSIHGGVNDNVIPESVDILGTIRFLSKKVQKEIHAEIERALGVAKALGGDYELDIIEGYPPMHNHPETVKLIGEVAGDLIGAEKIKQWKPGMGSEDFGYFIEDIPGAMFYLGCEIEGDPRRHHDPRFDVNEECFPIGAAILAETALRYLREDE
jgi:amidohydrolase